MAQETDRSRGTPTNYDLGRGGVPTEFGPYYGKVMNNVDYTRSGRLQVFIKAFNTGEDNNPNNWTTVRYLPPFYGSTMGGKSPTSGAGSFLGNQVSYGMWFTPPDVGVTVLCIFVNGDRSQGYYMGVVPIDQALHMIPAIGAAGSYEPNNAAQSAYLEGVQPVSELNVNNVGIKNSTRYYESKKPVQSVTAAALFQQGLAEDTERGPISSSAQRESPSACYGISTPGTAIYQGGLKPQDIKEKLNSGTVKPNELEVIGRMGGHTLVMDDGDIDGKNQLFRLRSAKGHQVMMNDTGNFIYIANANGQTWIELGAEGTVDIYSSNSVNVRTQGDLNLHADRDINMWAGRNIKMHAGKDLYAEADRNCVLSAQQSMKIYSKATVGIKADGSLALQSMSGSWLSPTGLKFTSVGIDFNGPVAGRVTKPQSIPRNKLDDVKFSTNKGWVEKRGNLETICNRAPTHEPYAGHGFGVKASVDMEPGQPSTPPDADTIPAGVTLNSQ